jgi:hypothetical protein
MCGLSSRLPILPDNDRKTAPPMENLREQIFQVTNTFLTTIQQLTEQHAALVLQETFSSLGAGKRRATPPTKSPRSQGAKRGVDELEALSKRFVQFVHDNPGLRIEQINKQLSTTTTELALPIRKLVSSGGLTTKGQKRSTTYFAGKSSAAPDVTSASAAEGKPSRKSSKTRARSKKRSAGTKSKK